MSKYLSTTTARESFLVPLPPLAEKEIGSIIISTRVAIDLGRIPEFTLKSLLQFTRDRGNRIVKRTARFSRMILSL